MVVLISGTTHTGKTALSQRLMERYKIPYLSIDHLKMGLIRSGRIQLTAEDDEELTPCLWAIVKEIVKTAIENGQSLIIEGCYIPFDWRKDFGAEYLSEIKFYCLIMTRGYIENNFSDIVNFESIIERRMEGGADKNALIEDNEKNLRLCKEYGLPYILIDRTYAVEIEL